MLKDDWIVGDVGHAETHNAMARLLNRTIDPVSFGATGIAGDSQRAALQAMFDAAQDGSTIVFPPGIYGEVIDTQGVTVTGKHHLTLVGSWGAVLQAKRGTPPGWSKIIRFDNCDGLTIRDLAFDINGNDRFSGVEFYDCQNVLIDHCHAFDSASQPNPADKDRRSFYFWSNDPANSRTQGVRIRNCLIEDLQLEVHAAKRVWIEGNEVYRSGVTGGILLITAGDNQTIEDVWVHDNYIADVDGGAIYILAEGSPDNNAYRRLHINNNTIRMGTAKSSRGIYLVTGNNSIATTGNVFEDAEISGNTIVVTASADALPEWEGILVNNSLTAAVNVRRISIHHNRIVGNGVGTGIEARNATQLDIGDNIIVGVANDVVVA